MSDQERIAELEAIIREALADIDNANLDSPSDRLWNARITLSRAPQGAAEPKRPVLTEEQIKAAFWAGAKSFIRIDWDGPDDEVRIGRMWQDKRDALLAAGDIPADRKAAEQ